MEREIRTQARRIDTLVKATGKIFHDYEDLNSWLWQHMQKYLPDGARDLLEEERQEMKPLPPGDTDILCHVETMTASKHGTIRYKKSIYSVPDSMIMTDCRVIVGPYQIFIEKPGHAKLSCTHPRKEAGTHSILLEHVLPSLVRKPGAMIRWAHRDLLFPEPSFQQYFRWLSKTLPEGQEREYLKSINLIQFVSLKEIGLAMDIVQRNKSTNPFDDLKVLLLLTPAPSPAVIDQNPIQTVLSTYDELIPKNQEISA